MGTNDVDPAWSAGEKTARPVSDNNVVFDSKNIDSRPKTEFFVNVEGADERKKEVVRRLKEQKQELAKQARQDKRNAKLAAFEQARQTRRAKIKNTLKHFFKKAKIPLIALCATVFVALAGWIVYRALNPPMSEEIKMGVESIKRQPELNADFSAELDARAHADDGSLEDAIKWGEEQIANAEDDHVKFIYYKELAYFIVHEDDYKDKAIEYAHKLEELAQDDGERYLAYMTLSTIYGFAGDHEKSDEYYDKLEEVKAPMEYAIEEEIKNGAQ
ncbi:hypothetical protein IJ102_00510 [Candidatus Saccharibacteria bacterium]|nr:hypothetical protein [Candidatus Saccharibacteria bacterium]